MNKWLGTTWPRQWGIKLTITSTPLLNLAPTHVSLNGTSNCQHLLDRWKGGMRQVLWAGALGRPRGMGWRGRREGTSGWGTHVNPWLIHVNVWQKPLQYCKVISLQLIKINGKKKEKAREFQKNIYFCYIDFAKAFDCVDHNKLENSERDGNTRPPDLPASWETCMQVRKQQLELDMEQQTGSK